MLLIEDLIPRVTGNISLYNIKYSRSDRHKPRAIDLIFSQPNQIQAGWGAAVAQLLMGNRNYAINTMYIEYENVASPGDAVTVPTYSTTDGVEYYDDLLLSSNRDFLRVPLLVNPSLGVAAGFENVFDGVTAGNKLTYFTQSQGSVGYHGKSFSDSVNSKIFGVALVAAPDAQDQSKDLIFARAYFSLANQTLKQASSQVGITWDISLLV